MRAELGAAITGVVSAPVLPGPDLPEAALAAWRVIGQEPSWEKAVFDLADGIPAGYQREYGDCRNPDKAGDERCSVPDLFVTLQARGAAAQRVCVECERGRYSSQALKHKLRWTLHNYAQAGFAGVYYVTPAVPEARLIQRHLMKLNVIKLSGLRWGALGMKSYCERSKSRCSPGAISAPHLNLMTL